MSIWQRLLNWIGLRPKSGSRTYEISESLQVTLATIAKHEGRPEDELLPDVLAAGLTQYVSKDKLWNKWQSLTAREQDVLRLLAQGRTNRQIGEALFISGKTASVHVSNILAKLGAASRGEAVAIAYREGLIKPEHTASG